MSVASKRMVNNIFYVSINFFEDRPYGTFNLIDVWNDSGHGMCFNDHHFSTQKRHQLTP